MGLAQLYNRSSRSVATPTVAELFRIAATEQAVLMGRNGTGKSTLARTLLRNWLYVVVIDPKGEFDLPDATIIEDPREVGRIKGRESVKPIIYRPAPQFWSPAWYDAIYEWIYLRQNCTQYTDEQLAVMGDSTRVPPYEQAVLTRGRSRHIRSITASQRPFKIPLAVLSEAKHYFQFDLSLDDDRKRMQELGGPAYREAHLEDYHFWYWSKGGQHRRPQKYVLKL